VTPPIISSKAKHIPRRKPAIPSSFRLSHCPGLARSCQRERAVLVTEDASAPDQKGQTRSHSPRRHRRAPTGRRVRIEDYHNGGKSRKRSVQSSVSKPFFTPSRERESDGPVVGRQHLHGRKPASTALVCGRPADDHRRGGDTRLRYQSRLPPHPPGLPPQATGTHNEPSRSLHCVQNERRQTPHGCYMEVVCCPLWSRFCPTGCSSPSPLSALSLATTIVWLLVAMASSLAHTRGCE
jgi:hypothetical protein